MAEIIKLGDAEIRVGIGKKDTVRIMLQWPDETGPDIRLEKRVQSLAQAVMQKNHYALSKDIERIGQKDATILKLSFQEPSEELANEARKALTRAIAWLDQNVQNENSFTAHKVLFPKARKIAATHPKSSSAGNIAVQERAEEMSGSAPPVRIRHINAAVGYKRVHSEEGAEGERTYELRLSIQDNGHPNPHNEQNHILLKELRKVITAVFTDSNVRHTFREEGDAVIFRFSPNTASMLDTPENIMKTVEMTLDNVAVAAQDSPRELLESVIERHSKAIINEVLKSSQGIEEALATGSQNQKNPSNTPLRTWARKSIRKELEGARKEIHQIHQERALREKAHNTIDRELVFHGVDKNTRDAAVDKIHAILNEREAPPAQDMQERRPRSVIIEDTASNRKLEQVIAVIDDLYKQAPPDYGYPQGDGILAARERHSSAQYMALRIIKAYDAVVAPSQGRRQ